MELRVVKLPTARRAWCCCPSVGWSSSAASPGPAAFAALARDDERLPTMLAGLHFAAFACPMLRQFIHTWRP
jgi:hypothetical protein